MKVGIPDVLDGYERVALVHTHPRVRLSDPRTWTNPNDFSDKDLRAASIYGTIYIVNPNAISAVDSAYVNPNPGFRKYVPVGERTVFSGLKF